MRHPQVPLANLLLSSSPADRAQGVELLGMFVELKEATRTRLLERGLRIGHPWYEIQGLIQDYPVGDVVFMADMTRPQREVTLFNVDAYEQSLPTDAPHYQITKLRLDMMRHECRYSKPLAAARAALRSLLASEGS